MEPDVPTLTLGLVVKLEWDVRISLDGDGGFSVRQLGQHFLFKPATVQALWTVIQTLHAISERLTRYSTLLATPPIGGKRRQSCPDSDWVESNYVVTSSQSCINEWHVMTDILVKRPASPDRASLASLKEDTEVTIKCRLRAIMKTCDLDTITSKSIRLALEADMGENLGSYKPFIDKEILLILGQMDPASKITDFLYLGSEWNASNLEELRQNGITHILNVTREIDNFFPGDFTYLNIREYDVEATDLLKYLDRTYKFIKSAKEDNCKVLVHCKMGISRSATVTIAFLMKECDTEQYETLARVKACRSIVNPNRSFRKQLEVYEGMLRAIRHRHTHFGGSGRLYRSKSESSVVPTSSEPSPPPPNHNATPTSSLSDASSSSSEDVSEGGAKVKTAKVKVRKAAAGGNNNGRKVKTTVKNSSSFSSSSTRKKQVIMSYKVDVKALSSAFNRPNSEPLSVGASSSSVFRPKAWSTSDQQETKDKDGKETEGGNKECRCFGELTQNENQDKPNESRNVHGFAATSAPPNSSSSTATPPSNPRRPVNSSRYDPSACSCDMEVELPTVPDTPIRIIDDAPVEDGDKDRNTMEAVVSSMSILPLQMRTSLENNKQAATPSSPKLIKSSEHPPVFEEESDVVKNEEENVLVKVEKAATPGGVDEGLSVHTLASMFNYKANSGHHHNSNRPPCSPARLEDSHLFQKAKKLSTDLSAKDETSRKANPQLESSDKPMATENETKEPGQSSEC